MRFRLILEIVKRSGSFDLLTTHTKMQAKVDSNRLAERDGTAADILGLSEVGSLSIIRQDQKRVTRMDEFQFRQIIVITHAKTPHGMAKPIMATVARTGPTPQIGIQ